MPEVKLCTTPFSPDAIIKHHRHTTEIALTKHAKLQVLSVRFLTAGISQHEGAS